MRSANNVGNAVPQIKYHVFNAVTNSELTELVPVFTIRPAFPTSVKKVSTSFKNVWRTGGPALPTLLADLMNCKYRNKFGQLGIRNRIEYVIFYLFLVNIIGNCHENKNFIQ
jgi:hypothetical protein